MPLFTRETIQQLRNASLEQEKTGSLPTATLEFIYQQKLFKLFVPEEFSGKMTGLPEAVRIFEQCSFIDGSFGWAVTIGAGGGFFSAYLLPAVAAKLFSPKNAVVAGSGHPTGTAIKVAGGYQVSGQWKYCSGANYATIFTANCFINETGKPDQMRAFTFLPEQVQILEDWNTFGLKATGSHSIKADNVFVPEEYTFDLEQPTVNPLPLIFQYPFLQFAQASFAAVNLGICRHFLDEVKTLIMQNEANWQKTSPKRYAFMQKKWKAASEILEETSSNFYQLIERSWQTLENRQEFTEGLLQQISWQCKRSVRDAVQAAQEIFPYLGLSAANESTTLNQTYRDLHTACQHTLLLDFEEVHA